MFGDVEVEIVDVNVAELFGGVCAEAFEELEALREELYTFSSSSAVVFCPFSDPFSSCDCITTILFELL